MLQGQPGGEHGLSNIPSGTVTFLFTDIEGSTKLLDSLGKQYANVLEEQRGILREAFARWNGLEIDTLGDASFVAFRRAIDAVHCAAEIQRLMAGHAWPAEAQVRVRIGLHTGEPLVATDEAGLGGVISGDQAKVRPRYIGMDVHRAARIASAGYGGQILLSQTTRDLVYQDLPEDIALSDLGVHQLKDIRHPQHIYQLDVQGLPAEFPPLKTLSMVAEPGLADDLAQTAPAGQREVYAYRNLLKRWRAQGQETLDKASLAMLLGAPPELTVDQDDLIFLLRSALKYELSLDSWTKWARSPSQVIQALGQLLQEYPRPQSRLTIVEALCQFADPQATQILLNIALTDDAHKVRSRAAVEAASRRQHEPVIRELTRQAQEQGDPAAVAALVAVIDEFGLPSGTWAYPKFPVASGLFQRRWKRRQEAIWRLSIRGALGSGLALGLLGSSLPLLALFVNPGVFEKNLQFFPIAAWSLSGAIAAMVWGGLQGLASSLAVSGADLLSPVWRSPVLRFSAGGISGMIFSFLMIVFAAAGLFSPVAGPAVYIPVFLLYGFFQGGALSWVINRPGKPITWGRMAARILQTTAFIGLVAVPSIYLVYQASSLSRLPIDGLYAILISSGLALATRKG
ncbi:MAG: adenylate/guanylate cyclase domain-containing protein [Omnitrophica WOR_2 bacterium]